MRRASPRDATRGVSPSSTRSSTSSPISASPRTSSSMRFPAPAHRPAVADRPRRGRLPARATCSRRSTSTCAPNTPGRALSPGERQLVEVAKALQLDVAIVIFDEPTTSLTARETDRLFALDRPPAELGQGDHLHLAHPRRRQPPRRRSSRCCATASWSAAGPAADFTIARMITLMLGRSHRPALSGAHRSRRYRRVSRSRSATSPRPAIVKRHQLQLAPRRGARAVRPDGLRPDGAGAHAVRPRSAGLRRDRDRRPAASPAASARGEHPPRHGFRHREPPRGGPDDECRRSPRTSRSPRWPMFRLTPLEFVDTGRLSRRRRSLRGGVADQGQVARRQPATQPLRRQPAEGGDRQVADVGAVRSSSSTSRLAASTSASKYRDLLDHRPPRRRRRRGDLHLVGARGADRHVPTASW